MKRIIVFVVVSLSLSASYSQIDTLLYKSEIRLSLGDAVITSFVRLDGGKYTNLSLAYFYRPEKILWMGINFHNYLGEEINYDWREYDVNGNFKDLTKSKMKYCAILAPELRISYVNGSAVIIYCSFAVGFGLENGYDTRYDKYPNLFNCFNLTWFGFSCNFGKNKNILFGGECGFGFKGLGSIHAGYRF